MQYQNGTPQTEIECYLLIKEKVFLYINFLVESLFKKDNHRH